MRAMKVAVLSYPMLFQTKGGLQIQVLETIEHLNALGCEARLIDPNREHLSGFDMVHVFSAINGNQRIVEHARGFKVPCVVSPLIQPHWTVSLGRRARFADRLVGKITGWQVSTESRQIATAIELADHLIALGKVEQQRLVETFGSSPERVTVIPNGVPERFFGADATPFCERFDVAPGYALCVASIDAYKNQLGLARALAGTDVPLILVGDCLPSNRAYLDQLTAMPGVRHVGGFAHDDPMLAAAYAGAGVLGLVSPSEVMPLTVLEALAAGTPAVLTRNHSMDLDGALSGFVTEVDASSSGQIRDAVLRALANPAPRAAVTDSVRDLTWRAVGRRVLDVYERTRASR